MTYAESALEEVLLHWLGELGWDYIPGPILAPDGEAPERQSWDDTLLQRRLRAALAKLNPELPSETIDDAYRRVTTLPGSTVETINQAFHRYVTDGVPVEYVSESEGRVVGDRARLFDLENVDNNDWLAVNQLTIVENRNTRRPDVVLYVNGLPLVSVELKKFGDENATLQGAYNQFQTYKAQIPSLFHWNELLIISDGAEARMGTITSPFERFSPWKTIDGDREHEGYDQLQVLTHGVFQKSRLLDLIRSFVVFEVDREVAKKVAAYHQYWAVNKAIESTIEASSHDGDRQVGVVWHTQGSGKSLSMVFYAGKLIRDLRMGNPTLVVLTDRNDLDGQLFDNFALAEGLVGTPKQAEDRDHLRRLLDVKSGGVIFTTVQKFTKREDEERYPCLSDRSNIVVIADEAHRSQYGFIDGFARHIHDALPNASFIGFTGTPIEVGDRVTRTVFGDYIDIYDIAQAVDDGATVPLYYEARLVELEIDEAERADLDTEVAEVTEGEEEASQSRAMSKWARIEKVVGTERRLRTVAEDIVTHFENRTAALDGKALVVCMSRRICADLYDEIVALRPDWHSDKDEEGSIKVVMTGNATDPAHLQQHVRPKIRNRALADRLKEPTDPLKMVLVRDMWLTGFDAPVLHTMYVDKPMKGHGLMQAIARVNRVFRSKTGGLIVDYLGLGQALKQAVRDYTESQGRGDVVVDQALAVQAMQEKLEVVRGIIHPFNYSGAFTDDAVKKYAAATDGLDFVLADKDRSDRYRAGVRDLRKAFGLAGASEEALRARNEVAYFLGLYGQMEKLSPERASLEAVDLAMGQLLSKAVMSDGVTDIFAKAGLDRPDISLMSDEFLAEVRELPQRNLAAAALEKLLRDELKVRRRTNVVEARKFSDMLDATMAKYHNRAIEAAQVVIQLIEMANEFRALAARGAQLNLTEPELAFYDALAENGSAKELMGDETLAAIARELASKIRNSVTVDWSVKKSVKAQLRLDVKRLLRKYRYPPDQQESATQLVLEQAEALADVWQ